MQMPSQLLYGPGHYPIQVFGLFTETLQYKDKIILFIVKDLKINLLGLPTITALKLAARIDDIADYHTIIEGSFPAVFKGLGNRREPYVISSFFTCSHTHFMFPEMFLSH